MANLKKAKDVSVIKFYEGTIDDYKKYYSEYLTDEERERQDGIIIFIHEDSDSMDGYIRANGVYYYCCNTKETIEKITELLADMSTVKGNISDLKTALVEAENEIAENKEKIEKCEAKIDELNKIASWANEEEYTTTYELGTVSKIDDVEATVTSATVKYTVIPTYHYSDRTVVGDPIDCSREVTFKANTSTEVVERSGSFSDAEHGNVLVKWSLKQNGEKFVPDGFVDLGLSIFWAKCNLGADEISDFGDFFAWGETIGYDDSFKEKKFAWSDYKWGTNFDDLTKYNAKDGLTVLEDADDVVMAKYGSEYEYRMPTKAEIEELAALDHFVDEVNGVPGMTFIGKNEKTLFFPFASYCLNGSHNYAGQNFYIWTKELETDGSEYLNEGYVLLGDLNNREIVGSAFRCTGITIRPVCKC